MAINILNKKAKILSLKSPYAKINPLSFLENTVKNYKKIDKERDKK